MSEIQDENPYVDFPPLGYRPDSLNKLLANALDLTAPASDALLKNRKNAWVQLAGHPGAFAPAGPHTIWKRRLTKENYETVAYQSLMSDTMREFVPRFYREVEYNEELFIEMEDLLQHFTDLSIMDIKMGSRTFLESEVENPILRKDLYDKMVNINPDEPSEEEHEQKAITKLRYMQFRERGSSTSSLGFRVEAIRMSGEPPDTDLKTVKSREEVTKLVTKYLGGNASVRNIFLERFQDLRKHFEQSAFFKEHEIIGSSLLLMYDKHNKASAWMIDFAKTLQSEDRTLDHRTPWAVGNHEDGYLFGLDNLISIISDVQCCNDRKSAASKGAHLTLKTR